MKHIKTIKISLSTSLALLLVNLFLPSNAFADTMDYQVYVKPSLNLTLSSNNLTLSLNPADHAFDHINLDTTVATNNPNGYKLYLNTTTGSGSDNSTELVNTINSSYTIPTLLSSITESSFPANYWGYRLNPNTTTNTTDASTTNTNTEYLPYTPNTLISQSPTNSNGISSTIDFAAKIDYNKPAGTYNIAFNLQALPQVTQYYMQDLVNTAEDPNLTTRVCTETPTMVMDKRDGHTYAIARLKDGKCWMVQNLRLGENLEPVTGSLTLTDEDTNISTTDEYNPRSTFTLTNQAVDGKIPAKKIGAAYYWDGPAFYCNNYGCFYNWHTATAGVKAENNDDILISADVTTSICPKGWILPTDGTHDNSHHSDIRIMLDAYGFGVDPTADVISELLVKPVNVMDNTNGLNKPGFTLGGWYSTQGGNVVGDASAIISRSYAGEAGRVYNFYFTKTSLRAIDTGNLSNALSVRCLLQESE